MSSTVERADCVCEKERHTKRFSISWAHSNYVFYKSFFFFFCRATNIEKNGINCQRNHFQIILLIQSRSNFVVQIKEIYKSTWNKWKNKNDKFSCSFRLCTLNLNNNYAKINRIQTCHQTICRPITFTLSKRNEINFNCIITKNISEMISFLLLFDDERR